MKSQVFQGGPRAPRMNITPLIDVVFLLIVFFMLVSNIAAQQMVEMIVPELEDSRAQALPEEDRLIVNAVPQRYVRAERAADPLAFDGQARGVRVGSGPLLPMEALAEVRGHVGERVEANPDLEVILRADGAIHYQQLQPLMQAIAEAGVARLHLVAYTEERGAANAAGD